MATSNLAVLTKSHGIVAAKKRAKREQLKEIVFDDAARRDFLTGFHKRKVQKKEAAKQKAKEREKQERLEARREHRHMLADQARKNAEEAERAYGGMPDLDNESEWDGTGRNSALADKGKGVGEELEEYEDEEQLATVTVVEEFDPDTFLYGKPSGPESTDDQFPPRPDKIPSRSHPPQPAKATSKDTSKAKVKAKVSTKVNNVKYQTSAARKAERAKQHRRKTEKAERAGGKASRRGGSKGRR